MFTASGGRRKTSTRQPAATQEEPKCLVTLGEEETIAESSTPAEAAAGTEGH